jgi:type I restriction-modification system DNA methylase subunit
MSAGVLRAAPSVGAVEAQLCTIQRTAAEGAGDVLDVFARALLPRLRALLERERREGELVDVASTVALMNLYLHGIEPRITNNDSIADPPSGERFDVVLTNPPFGNKGGRTERHLHRTIKHSGTGRHGPPL